MLYGKRLAIVEEGDERILGEKVIEREVGGPNMVECVDKDVAGIGSDAAGLLNELPRRYTFPDVAETRPPSDAMKAGKNTRTRKLLKLRPSVFGFVFHEAG